MPFRRCGGHHTAGVAVGNHNRRSGANRADIRRKAACGWTDEYPACGERRRSVDDRSKSARIAHGSVRVEGCRLVARRRCRSLHGRRETEGHRTSGIRLPGKQEAGDRKSGVAALLLCKRGRIPFRQVPRDGYNPRAGNEIDRRSDGVRPQCRDRLLQEPNRLGQPFAGQRRYRSFGAGRRQSDGCGTCQKARCARL